MSYPYGMRGSPAVGGGLPGLPRRDNLSFNEVIESYSQVLTGPAVDVPIPFSFSSPAELDVIVHLVSTPGDLEPPTMIISGSPNGLAARRNYGSTAAWNTFEIIGNLLRITNTSASLRGRVHILRRNRVVKNYAFLPLSTTENTLPFTISNPHKTMITNNSTLPAGVYSSLFIHDYYDLSTELESWHLSGVDSTSYGVKIISPTTYITKAGASYFTITEFE